MDIDLNLLGPYACHLTKGKKEVNPRRQSASRRANFTALYKKQSVKFIQDPYAKRQDRQHKMEEHRRERRSMRIAEGRKATITEMTNELNMMIQEDSSNEISELESSVASSLSISQPNNKVLVSNTKPGDRDDNMDLKDNNKNEVPRMNFVNNMDSMSTTNSCYNFNSKAAQKQDQNRKPNALPKVAESQSRRDQLQKWKKEKEAAETKAKRTVKQPFKVGAPVPKQPLMSTSSSTASLVKSINSTTNVNTLNGTGSKTAVSAINGQKPTSVVAPSKKPAGVTATRPETVPARQPTGAAAARPRIVSTRQPTVTASIRQPNGTAPTRQPTGTASTRQATGTISARSETVHTRQPTATTSARPGTAPTKQQTGVASSRQVTGAASTKQPVGALPGRVASARGPPSTGGNKNTSRQESSSQSVQSENGRRITRAMSKTQTPAPVAPVVSGSKIKNHMATNPNLQDEKSQSPKINVIEQQLPEKVVKKKKAKPKPIDATYTDYNGRFSDACRKLGELSKDWKVILDENCETVPEETRDEIFSALGKVKLLLESKLPQFGELLYAYLCKDEDATIILACDLEGWWDVAYIQVEAVYKIFETLTTLKNNNWTTPSVVLVPEAKFLSKEPSQSENASLAPPPQRRRVSKPKVQASGGLKAFLANQRKKNLCGASEEAMESDPPVNTFCTSVTPAISAEPTTPKQKPTVHEKSSLDNSLQQGEPGHPNKMFEGGFFTISSPLATPTTPRGLKRDSVSSAKSTITLASGVSPALPLRTPTRRGRLSGVSSSTDASLRRQSFTMLGVRRSKGNLCRIGVSVFTEDKGENEMDSSLNV